MCGSNRQPTLVQPKPAAIEETGQCACAGRSASKAGDDIVWKGAASDMTFPPVPFPSRRVFGATGEAMLRELVQRHHERMLDTRVGHLFSRDRELFLAGVKRTADFMVEATDGLVGTAHTPV